MANQTNDQFHHYRLLQLIIINLYEKSRKLLLQITTLTMPIKNLPAHRFYLPSRGVIPPVPFYRVYTRKNSDAIGQLSVGGRDRNYVDATRIGLSAGCRGSSSIREWHFEEILWCHTSFIISRELHLLQNLECVLNAPNGRILVMFHSYRFVSWLSDIGVVRD